MNPTSSWASSNCHEHPPHLSNFLTLWMLAMQNCISIKGSKQDRGTLRIYHLTGRWYPFNLLWAREVTYELSMANIHIFFDGALCYLWSPSLLHAASTASYYTIDCDAASCSTVCLPDVLKVWIDGYPNLAVMATILKASNYLIHLLANLWPCNACFYCQHYGTTRSTRGESVMHGMYSVLTEIIVDWHTIDVHHSNIYAFITTTFHFRWMTYSVSWWADCVLEEELWYILQHRPSQKLAIPDLNSTPMKRKPWQHWGLTMASEY